MINFNRLFTVICLVLLSGCQKVYETQYDYNQPVAETGRQCVTQCQRAKAVCEKHCQDPAACKKQAKTKALEDYALYVSAQEQKGLPVTKDSNSFYNPLQCSQELCQCDSDYRACYELCGGTISSRQVCIKNCD